MSVSVSRRSPTLRTTRVKSYVSTACPWMLRVIVAMSVTRHASGPFVPSVRTAVAHPRRLNRTPIVTNARRGKTGRFHRWGIDNPPCEWGGGTLVDVQAGFNAPELDGQAVAPFGDSARVAPVASNASISAVS